MQLPTEFFLSKKFIKSVIIRNGILTLLYVFIIFFLLPYFFSSDRIDVLGIYFTIAFLAGVGYWIWRLMSPSAEQPVFKINKTCLKIGYQQEGVRILFDDIALVEIKENYFGRKLLNIVYNKELTYKIKQPLHMKMMFFFEFNKARLSQKWNLGGLGVEPEVLAQSINYYLEQHQAEAELIRNQEIYPPYNTY